jgi:hypothetical protein
VIAVVPGGSGRSLVTPATAAHAVALAADNHTAPQVWMLAVAGAMLAVAIGVLVATAALYVVVRHQRSVDSPPTEVLTVPTTVGPSRNLGADRIQGAMGFATSTAAFLDALEHPEPARAGRTRRIPRSRRGRRP